MVRDPILQTGSLAVIGAGVTRFALRGHPRRRLIGQVVFFTALTLLLLYHGIVPYDPSPPDVSVVQRVFIGLAKIVWWTNAAWSLTAFVRVFLILEGQKREGRLLQDLVVGIIYVGAVLSVIAYVFNAPVGTLIATSGVFAVILGLAMQSTLSDVFSGIALNLGRPYRIGDLIALNDGIEGRVVETNWRATHILNAANDLVIVPNSDLAKARLTNLSSPERSHGSKLVVRFAPTTSPAGMAEVMRSVMLSSTSILSTPEPGVQVKSMDANAVELELSFRVADVSAAGKAQNEIFDLVYRHAKAAGFRLAAPTSGSGIGDAHAQNDRPDGKGRSTPLRLLDAVPLFSGLTEDEREALAATMARRTYQTDEVLVEEGAVLASLFIVRTGVVLVSGRDEGHDVELGRLAPGDFFGEGGLLMGAGEPGTLRALTFAVVYEIAKDGLAPLLRDRPGIAEELGQLLSRRDSATKHRFDHSHDRDSADLTPGLVARIRHLFELPRQDGH